MNTPNERSSKETARRLIDKVLFEQLLNDKQVLEEILRTILNDEYLTVLDFFINATIRIVSGCPARIETICKMSTGEKIHVTVQRINSQDDIKRTTLADHILIEEDDVPWNLRGSCWDRHDICVSERDIFAGGKTTYHLDQVIRETNKIAPGEYLRTFINAEIDDGSPIAGMMSVLWGRTLDRQRFPALSERMSF